MTQLMYVCYLDFWGVVQVGRHATKHWLLFCILFVDFLVLFMFLVHTGVCDWSLLPKNMTLKEIIFSAVIYSCTLLANSPGYLLYSVSILHSLFPLQTFCMWYLRGHCSLPVFGSRCFWKRCLFSCCYIKFHRGWKSGGCHHWLLLYVVKTYVLAVSCLWHPDV